MEAASQRRLLLCAVVTALLACLIGNSADAANSRSRNFLIHAPTQQLADAVAEAAETYRRDLAVHWLGAPLPDWPTPCPIRVVAGPRLAAQGVTTYNPRPVSDFQMEVVGTPERILDSVLPHEVTHTILATHFGRPLPRWADEGICTTVEHASERNKHEKKLREFLRTRRGIAMNQLFLMTEYPSDVLPMYAQGYSVCRFLIDQQGPQTFIAFLHDYMKRPSWTANIKKHYGYESLAELQEYWLAWVDSGSQSVEKFAKRSAPGQDALAASGVSTASLASSGPAGRVLSSADPAIQRASSADSAMALSGPQVARSDQPPEIASAASQGWYQRKRMEVVARGGPPRNSPTVSKQMVPPSVRSSGSYQSAHPQPEQRISRQGAAVDRVFDAAPSRSRWR